MAAMPISDQNATVNGSSRNDCAQLNSAMTARAAASMVAEIR
jgi:hypothetical protein